MTSHALESVALTLVAGGKGILAADETVPPRRLIGASIPPRRCNVQSSMRGDQRRR